MKGCGSITVVLLSAVIASCLFGQAFSCYCSIFREFEAALLLLFQWMLFACLTIWCGSFIFLTFSLNDLPFIGLLLIAIAAYFIGYRTSLPVSDAIILLAGVTLGKGVRSFLEKNGKRKAESENFLIGLVVLLAFASWWHLNMIGAYHGSRWMGLWNNPNIYGMLMGDGVVLSAGLLADRRWKMEDGKNQSLKSEGGSQNFLRSLCSFAAVGNWQSAVLFIAAFMMGVGLVMSYSRGAWLAMAIGLLYLTWCYGKLKWRYVLPGIVLVAVAVLFFWSRTPDSAPWYVKRADLGRPSAQHRVTAWRAGFEIMRDHPFGVGWNRTVEIYDKNYSPPEDGAAAITTNDYLMLGTQLGIPALLCFLGYAALCLRGKPKIETEEGRILAACRAGAIVFLVAFWFDGGLFKLATASVFWILLELGANQAGAMMRRLGK